MDDEFTDEQVLCAINAFLARGASDEHSYFSGDGWAARCLRFHRDRMERQRLEDVEEQLTSAIIGAKGVRRDLLREISEARKLGEKLRSITQSMRAAAGPAQK